MCSNCDNTDFRKIQFTYCQSLFQTDDDPFSLFDNELLKQVDLSKGNCRLDKCGLSTSNVGDSLCMRSLCSNDFEKGKYNYLKLLLLYELMLNIYIYILSFMNY